MVPKMQDGSLMVGKEIQGRESPGKDMYSFIHCTFTEHFLCMWQAPPRMQETQSSMLRSLPQ